MQAIANIHPSHLHVVAASVVEEQIGIRHQIHALINDFATRASAQPAAGSAALRRMSCVPPTSSRSHNRTDSRHRTTTTSIIPSQLVDMWPEIFKHLLRRTKQLRCRLDKVFRILTREACTSVVVDALDRKRLTPNQWVALASAGLRDSVELQLMMEMMFSNIHGCREHPTRQWHTTFLELAAMKGWQLPPVRVFEFGDLSCEEEEDNWEWSKLRQRFKTAGFCVQVLRQPFYNHNIHPKDVVYT